jgi:CheY-like chemotaxis protein
MMSSALILFIDDNQTVRKVVEGYLSQAGYRVLLASSAERGLELAQTSQPDLILLDHQLPGTTGDQLCRKLLESDATAKIPVVICSAMRNKAFVQYADFPNVIDQIPKPFTAELLRAGVGSALQTGLQVVQAQRSGSSMPEAVDSEFEPVLQGTTAVFPLRSILRFLNRDQYSGRLVVEVDKDRVCFAISSGRLQAVFSPTASATEFAGLLPKDLADLGPLLVVSLAEREDSQVSGLVRLLEKSLADPRRLRALLRFQASVLTYRAMTAGPGPFEFFAGGELPPIFQAFPLNVSLPALTVEGVRRCDPISDPSTWANLVYHRSTFGGSNPDRAGLSPLAVKLHASLDGRRDLAAIAREFEVNLEDAAYLARGLELAGLVERRSEEVLILVLEDDPATIEVIQEALSSESLKCQFKIVQDRVAAQLLLRRARFDIIVVSIDGPEEEQLYNVLRTQVAAEMRFVGIASVSEESELMRLDSIGLDGIIERPVSKGAIIETIKMLSQARFLSMVS